MTVNLTCSPTVYITCNPTLCLACLSVACPEQRTTSLGLALPMQSAVQAKANAVLVLNSHSYMILTPNYVCVCVCCDNSFAESSQSLRSNLKTNIHYKY